MLGLGLASSHAPAMFEPKERWPLVYSRIPEYTKESQPHTAKLETPGVIQGYAAAATATSGATAAARLRRCWDVERRLKSGGDARAELAALVAELCAG